MVPCECEGEEGWVSKWSWQWKEDHIAECYECAPRRVERDWQLLTRYVVIDGDGRRSTIPPTGGGDKHKKRSKPLNCLYRSTCPQTGVCWDF